MTADRTDRRGSTPRIYRSGSVWVCWSKDYLGILTGLGSDPDKAYTDWRLRYVTAGLDHQPAVSTQVSAEVSKL